MILSIIKLTFSLDVFFLLNIVSCVLSSEFLSGNENSPYNEQQRSAHGDSLSSDSVSGLHVYDLSTPISNSMEEMKLLKEKSSVKDDGLKRSLVDNLGSSSVQDSSLESKQSLLDSKQPYSVTSPFGVDGHPLLGDNTNNVRGYKAYPQTITMFHPVDGPARHGTIWNNFTPRERHPAGNSFWDSRRMGSFNGYSPTAAMTSRTGQMSREESMENQELVRSILTNALDILTEKADRETEYRNSMFETGGRRHKIGSSWGSKKKVGGKLKSCKNNYNSRRCKNVLAYYDVFGTWLRTLRQTQHGQDTNRLTRARLGGDRFLPQPRTRTVFRSVDSSPTSSLARLLNPGDSSTSGDDGHGSGGDGGGGSTSNHNTGGGGGGGGSISGNSGSGNSGSVFGVDLDMFNKFARDTVSFEQQSATEIKRLDSLLRQLAMAAQTDFTSVTNSVNELQGELVHTQQQLVQAWGILNATHVRDNLQTVGDLRDVKTDVYRLHALITGTTPRGQGTAQGRAAEVKEVATIGPGVDCAALYKSGVNTSGVYDLQPQPTDNGTRMTAFCDMETDGGGWTVFQRRSDGSDDFFRGWNSYKHGFGSYRHDHWLGLENIHLLTKYGDNVMRIELTDWENKTKWAEFSYTRIMDESDGYRILVGGYRGTAGDPFHSLSYSMRMQSMRFSTFDSDNDLDSGGNCALTFTSGWWFNKCFQVNLNGVWYGNSRYAGPSMNGIVWDLWPLHFNGYSLKHTEMKLRPEHFHNNK